MPTRNPWATYEQVNKEGATLPPLTIKGEVFNFPASPPAEFFLEFLEGLRQEALTEERIILMMLSLITDDDAARLKKVTTAAELLAIFNDLLDQYGFPSEAKGAEAAVPNREARRASQRKPSSKTSARSKRISSGTTKSKSRKS